MAHASKSHEAESNDTNVRKLSDKDMTSKRRKRKGEGNPLPMASSNFLSILTYSWLSGLMWKLYKTGAESITWWTCPESDSAELNMERLERIWDAEVKRKGIKKASFQWVLFRFLKTRICVASFIFLVRVGFFISGPAFAVLYLLRELSKDVVDVQFAVGMVVLLTCTETCRSVLLALAYNVNYVSAMRVRNGLLAFLYKRILKLRSLQDRTIGELVNLVSNDSQRIYDSVVTGPFLIGVPFLLVFGVVYTSILVGPFSLIGCLVFVLYQVFLFINSRWQLKFRRQAIVVTDQRVRIMNELLTFVQLVKMYVWEDSFADTVADVRDYERRILQKSAYMQYSSTSMTPLVPSLAGVFTVLAFILTDNNLTAAEAFTLISVFNVMVIALNKVQSSFKLLAEAYVGAERMKTLLILPQMKEQPIDPCDKESDAVVFTNASLAWNVAERMQFSSPALTVVRTETSNGENTETEGERLLLKNINLQVSKGDLVGICGTVGCGKTSLLEAILGRMIVIKGNITAGGKVAYACQQAWIMNDTARENILFGQEYDEEKYKRVVEVCCLKSDFEILPAGDQTEIGERGMNISGGQKQRLSLARAVYTGRDICLFDDPLSAVDAHVGKHIFKHCIQEYLKGKTVLFVTHQLQYLTNCKLVLFMKDGTIAETGTHQELMDRGGEYAQLLKIHHDSRKNHHKHQRHTPIHTPLSQSPKDEFRRRSSTLHGDFHEFRSESPTGEVMNKFITNIRERSRSLSERKKALRTDITRQKHGSPHRSFSKADDKHLLIKSSAGDTEMGVINPAYTKSVEGK